MRRPIRRNSRSIGNRSSNASTLSNAAATRATADEAVPPDDAAAAAAAGARASPEKFSDPFDADVRELKKRSVVAFKLGGSLQDVEAGRYPTNEQVVKALQSKVAESVEVARSYRRVLWYSVFVFVYLLLLYFQARAYQSADVVSTLRNALMVDGQLSMTFNNEDEVLAYIANKILLPTWQDPICGDGKCEFPWEYPAYGRFGCESDCGRETNTTTIAVNLRANFVGHPTVSARMLMSSVRWNLCLSDPDRKARGEAELCWFEEDQTFNDVKVNVIESAEVVEGQWYLIIKGDYTGRVVGTVYDVSNPRDPQPMELTPQWEKCRLPESAQDSNSRRMRRLLSEYRTKRESGDRDPELLLKLRKDIFPELPEVNHTEIMDSLNATLHKLVAKHKEITELKERIAHYQVKAPSEGGPDGGADDG